MEDRTDQRKWHIFTIDPRESADFDDAFSIINLDDGTKHLSIYISNVSVWMDILNLWDSFSRRISTIYLPDKKRPMLPTILSDCLCSLQENTTRIAFVMDILIKDNEIIDTKYSNCFIKVTKNYSYEEPSLLSNFRYHELLEQTHLLSKKYKYISNIRNSHDVVCYLMILMNYHCAKLLIQNKTGVFRSTIMKRDFIVPEWVPEDAAKFIKIWNSAAGQYIDGSEIVDTRHELLDVDAYIHITSPIRRLVDLMNMIKIQSITGIICLSDNSVNFYNKWLKDIDYINVTMRSIRKVQCDCTLLDLCHNSPEVMDKEYDGYIFDKINRNDGLFQYVVFLPELKLSSRITLRDNFDNFECKKFKLYLFNNEEKFKRKIRLSLLV
jgi:exoribonuclease R